MSEASQYLADFFKILADPIRLDIIESLKSGEKTANELKERFSISQAYTSQQLKKLLKTGIIGFLRKNNMNSYFLKDTRIIEIIKNISKFIFEKEAERLQTLKEITEKD